MEVHLFCTDDWMSTHNFNEEDKVQRFCLTLLGEARLWYETLNPTANDWLALQNALGDDIQNWETPQSNTILMEKFLF